MLHDPKVQHLPDAYFKIWTNLLCHATELDKNGRFGNVTVTSWALRCNEDVTREALQALIDQGLIIDEGHGYQIKNWSKRQYKSDTSAERVKRYRERNRNVTVTPPDTDSDTDTEKNIKNARARKFLWVDDGFETLFWPKYPNKVGKADARKAFNAIGKSDTVSINTIMRGVERYIHDKPSDRQWCNPGTWLRQERWLDEPGQVSKPNGKVGFGETAERMINELREESRDIEIGSDVDEQLTLPPAERV